MRSDEIRISADESSDVLEISDCRFPGQVSRALASEIGVQLDTRWTTAIAHVNGPLVARAVPFNPQLTEYIRGGAVRLLLAGDPPITTRLAIVRHPALLQPGLQLPPVIADAVIIIAPVGPNRDDGRPLYVPGMVEEISRTALGRRPVWAPTTQPVRDQILQQLPDAEITDDWQSDDSTRPFDPQRHRERLTVRLGPSSPAPATNPIPPDRRPAALFVTSNGAGMGHLTRLLAYARRLDGKLRTHFLSLSQAVGVVSAYGFPYEYLPSTGASGLGTREWNSLFATRLTESIRRINPEVVVFDGTYPYAGIALARRAAREPKWVWSRRAMWKAEHGGPRGREHLEKANLFDAVLEPGDFAESYDRGLTVGQPSHHVGPVTLLDESELVDRAPARKALGLPENGRMALVSLGAGNINDTSDDLGAAVESLRQLEVDVCVTQTEIGVVGTLPHDVHIVRHFPLSVYSRAFDVAVSASGYNSFHELLRFGVPSLFVPNQQTSLDDQVARARFASDRGLAHYVDAVRTEEAVELLDDLLGNGEQMIRRVREIDPGNGAAAGADLLVGLTSAARPVEYEHAVAKATEGGLV